MLKRGDRDETINHIIDGFSKLAQKEYKTRHDYVGMVILRELCKKLKFDHTIKWYMHNAGFVRENETQETPEILKYKWITKYQPSDKTEEKENLLNC